MELIRNILYVERRLTGSTRGFACALEAARSWGADLTVAGVVPGPGARGWPTRLAPGSAERRAALGRRWGRRLEDLAALGGREGVWVRTRVLEGPFAAVVEREVVAGAHDLVVAVGGRGGPARGGSGDRWLLRSCPCAVWLLDPAQGPGLGVVLVAVDVGSAASVERSRRLLRVGASLAARTSAELRVVHGWSVVGESILASPVRGVSRRRLRAVLAGTRRERRRRVEDLVSEAAPGRGVRLEVRKGEAGRVIRDVAWATQADVVVVGRSDRGGLESWLLGTTAESIAGRLPGSLLVVRDGAMADAEPADAGSGWRLAQGAGA